MTHQLNGGKPTYYFAIGEEGYRYTRTGIMRFESVLPSQSQTLHVQVDLYIASTAVTILVSWCPHLKLRRVLGCHIVSGVWGLLQAIMRESRKHQIYIFSKQRPYRMDRMQPEGGREISTCNPTVRWKPCILQFATIRVRTRVLCAYQPVRSWLL